MLYISKMLILQHANVQQKGIKDFKFGVLWVGWFQMSCGAASRWQWKG